MHDKRALKNAFEGNSIFFGNKYFQERKMDFFRDLIKES